MHHRRAIYAVIGLLALIILVGAIVTTTRSADAPLVRAMYIPSEPLRLHHSVENGLYHYSGALPLTTCNALSTGIATFGMRPVHATIILTVLTPAEPCDPRPLDQEFAVSFAPEASSTIRFQGVTVNGLIIPHTFEE